MTKKKKSSSKKKKAAAPKTVDVNQVIVDGDAAMEALDMDRALSCYKAASAILKGHVQLQVPEANPLLLARVLLKLGEVKVSCEDEEGARQDFEYATTLLGNDDDSLETHEIRASLCLYLGQLSSEKKALEAFRKGTAELQSCVRLKESQNDNDDMDTDHGMKSQQESLQDTRRQLSNAYCTVAELFLTDLCFEENAEQECEAAVMEAIKIHENGKPLVDSLQTMASLRLSQGRGEEAAKYMLQVYCQIKSGCEALAALVGLKNDEGDTQQQQAVELTDVDAANALPGFDFRCQTAKLLMECATAIKSSSSQSSTPTQGSIECSDAAIQVLASLLAENDEVIEVWYLMGCAFAAASPPDTDMAVQYWGRALELLARVKDHMELISDDEGLQEIVDQVDEVHKRLREIGHDPNNAETQDVEMIA